MQIPIYASEEQRSLWKGTVHKTMQINLGIPCVILLFKRTLVNIFNTYKFQRCYMNRAPTMSTLQNATHISAFCQNTWRRVRCLLNVSACQHELNRLSRKYVRHCSVVAGKYMCREQSLSLSLCFLAMSSVQVSQH